MGMNLFELVCKSFPGEIKPGELLKLASHDVWAKGDISAITAALRNSPIIDWGAYLAHYPDVKASGMDPCEHFVRHGIYEGRKLTRKLSHGLAMSVLPDESTAIFDKPLVSVIVCNYNNARFLEQCIKSVINQTLPNIEIIVVDDASTDNSVQIINKTLCAEPRSKFIAHESNQSIHMCRKHGAAIATGEYIMFLDSDDFYAPNACEIAYKAIREGCDVVAFSTEIVKMGCVEPSVYSALFNIATITEERIYYQSELRNAYFGDRTISWQIISKIFKTEIVNNIFSTMPNVSLHYGEDSFFIAVSLRYTHKLKTITDKLLNYRLGNGISTSRNPKYFLDTWFNLGDMTRELEIYAKKNFLDFPMLQFKYAQCFSSVWYWIKYCAPENYNRYFMLMLSQYGIECILRTLTYDFATQKDVAANCLRYVIGEIAPVKKPNIIGILCGQFAKGGSRRMLVTMSDALSEAGYKVVLIAEKFSAEDYSINEAAEYVRIHHASPEPAEALCRARDLRQILQSKKIDLLISTSPHSPCNLWDALVCWHEHTPLLMCLHGNYLTNFVPIALESLAQEHEAVWRCMASLACPNKEDVIYLRSLGINANYLPVPINSIYPAHSENNRPIIICVSRLPQDHNTLFSALEVLRAIKNKLPDILMNLIIKCENKKQRENIIEFIKANNLSRNCKITEYANDIGKYIAHGRIVMFTSFYRDLYISLSDILASGLPCVIYDVPTECIARNHGIISITKEDKEKTINTIIKIITDRNYYAILSQLARKGVAQLTLDQYKYALISWINNYNVCSSLLDYDLQQYKHIIQCLSAYAGQREQDVKHDHM